jgi:hypothetical protein
MRLELGLLRYPVPSKGYQISHYLLILRKITKTNTLRLRAMVSINYLYKVVRWFLGAQFIQLVWVEDGFGTARTALFHTFHI